MLKVLIKAYCGDYPKAQGDSNPVIMQIAQQYFYEGE